MSSICLIFIAFKKIVMPLIAVNVLKMNVHQSKFKIFRKLSIAVDQIMLAYA